MIAFIKNILARIFNKPKSKPIRFISEGGWGGLTDQEIKDIIKAKRDFRRSQGE